jgi:hypothetical protein
METKVAEAQVAKIAMIPCTIHGGSNVAQCQIELQCLNLQIPLRFSPKQSCTDLNIDTTAGTLARASSNSCKKHMISHPLQDRSSNKAFEKLLMSY